MTDLPDHVRRNRAVWDDRATEYAAPAEENWARETPTWGIWGVPESDLKLLPADVAGRDVIELGCGTAFVTLEWARQWPCEEVWKARKRR